MGSFVSRATFALLAATPPGRSDAFSDQEIIQVPPQRLRFPMCLLPGCVWSTSQQTTQHIIDQSTSLEQRAWGEVVAVAAHTLPFA